MDFKYIAIGLILPQTPTDFFFKDISPQRPKKRKKKNDYSHKFLKAGK